MSISITNAKILQTIIATRRPIQIDGHFGAKSLLAYNVLNGYDKSTVQRTSVLLDVQIDDPTSNRFFVSKEAVDTVVDEVSFLTNVPVSYLHVALQLENYGASDGNGFIVEVDGKYRGLGQFDRKTWDAVMQGVSYSTVGNTFNSVLAIARLYERNKRSFVVQGADPGKFNDSIAYLYHNQGAGSAFLFLKSGILKYPDQSLNAKRFFEKARLSYELRTT